MKLTFKYKIVRMIMGEFELNELGEEGWKLVWVDDRGIDPVFLFMKYVFKDF